MLKNLRTFVQSAGLALLLSIASGSASAQEGETPTVAPRPDIKAEAVRVPDGFKAGAGNRVLVRVRNLSSEVEVEVPFTVRLEVIREDGERTVLESTVDRLGRNQAREVIFAGVSVPHGRTVRFLLIADPDSLIEELNQGNNRYLFQVDVEGGTASPSSTPTPEETAPGEGLEESAEEEDLEDAPGESEESEALDQESEEPVVPEVPVEAPETPEETPETLEEAPETLEEASLPKE